MTTALEVITDALGELGVVGAGQSVSSNDSTLGLRYLNRIFERWSNQRLLQPVLTQLSVTQTGAASYTLGPGGSPTTRPIKVLHVTYVDAGGLEYQVDVLTREQWDAIPNKADTGSYPDRVWYAPELTNGVLYAYPKCSSGSLKVDCLAVMQTLALSGTLTLPPGYEAALVPTLALDLSAQYGVQPSPEIRRRSAAAINTLRRTNSEPLYSVQELAGAPRGDIFRGY